MSQRRTQADRKQFERTYLSEKIPHEWTGTPSRCTHCGRRFGPSAGIICPNRRKPGRWRLHCRRQMQRAMYRREIPKRDTAWLLSQLRECEREAERLARREGWDDRYWKYHKIARQYRKYLRQWWALPSVPYTGLTDTTDRQHAGADAARTRARNKLLARVRVEQVRQVQVEGTTYTFYADATYINEHGHRVALFTDTP